ncbi:hypothetical protein BDV96DRAFT_266195 [Lophiotrema nucula]|uniref:Zn(2)-C6 fungal-type domain-containing protein n=1 Tax=Lophiotrema nucula TaxID=690887 RepID=A0A6A5ZMP9_9PLEO|nr:hypothetical protein BDV96DRAFT_266195 [Lophiotrema nucula]
MKLACLRCKHKKIKCDKREPICHQCITALAECVYVERKKRPRLQERRVEMNVLNDRLIFLEKHLNEPTEQSTDRASVGSHASEQREPNTPDAALSTPSLVEGIGSELWIYRMAKDATTKFERVNATPTDTPGPSTVDTAMSALNDSLADLEILKVSPEHFGKDSQFSVSSEEGKACVQAFLEMLSDLVIPDLFTASAMEDLELLHLLPSIIDSPYVNVEPAARVLYYNALYYGLIKLRGVANPLARKAYFKALESVPLWLETSKASDLDIMTACLTTWTAINNFDYQLSWRFHCKSCQLSKTRGLDRLDCSPPATLEEERWREKMRPLCWQVLQTDLLFRLFYGKPSVWQWSVDRFKPPALISASNLHPNSSQVICYAVWMDYTILTVELFNALDEGTAGPEAVDVFCIKMETIINNWNLMSLLDAANCSPTCRWLYADHIMNTYTIIIGIKRLTREDNTPIDAITLRSARTVMDIILRFADMGTTLLETSFCFSHFITFYPFCAIFSLYEHILACKEPDECEQDVISLEAIGRILTDVCSLQSDWVPISRTVSALNKVSRIIQESRRRQPTQSTYLPSGQSPGQNALVNEQQPQLSEQQHAFADPNNLTVPIDETPPLPFPLEDFSDLSFLQDFPMMMEGGFQPVGFVRALESDLIGRNWQQSRWDVSGDSSGDILPTGMPDSI